MLLLKLMITAINGRTSVSHGQSLPGSRTANISVQVPLTGDREGPEQTLKAWGHFCSLAPLQRLYVSLQGDLRLHNGTYCPWVELVEHIGVSSITTPVLVMKH